MSNHTTTIYLGDHEFTVEFAVCPEQVETRDEPGIPASVDVWSIAIVREGVDITDVLHDFAARYPGGVEDEGLEAKLLEAADGDGYFG